MPDLGSIHILINHFPIILTIVGTAAAAVALLTRKRGVWLYATATLALAGLSAIPTFLTGEPAADQLRDSWWVTRQAVGAHEEAADWALWGLIIMGLIAAYAWWRAWRREPVVAVARPRVAGGVALDPTVTGTRAGVPGWLQGLVLAGALFGCALILRTAALGGDIVHHSTILGTTPRPASVPAPAPEPAAR